MSFFREQIDRFKEPWKHTAFKSYFIWVVILFGGVGVLVTIWQEYHKDIVNINSISESIATTFIGIIAASLVDLNLSYSIKNIPSLIINSMGAIAISIVFLLLSFMIIGGWSLLPAVIGYLLALIIWILANADNGKLSDESYLKNITQKINELQSATDDLQ